MTSLKSLETILVNSSNEFQPKHKTFVLKYDLNTIIKVKMCIYYLIKNA